MYLKQRHDELRRGRLFTTLLIIAVFIIAGAVLVFNRNGFKAITQIREDVQRLERQNDSLAAEIDSLNTVINQLQFDSLYIERRVREILGWGREDELIIRFVEPDN